MRRGAGLECVATAFQASGRGATDAGRVRSSAVAHQTFLRRRRNQSSVPTEPTPVGEAAGVLRRRPIDIVQHPLVESERAMEPHRMVEAGNLHARG